MLVTDVVIGKYWEEEATTCLSEKKKINFYPQKATTCINEKKKNQFFGFRGDKYVTKKVRVVSLARNKPTGPYLCLNPVL